MPIAKTCQLTNHLRRPLLLFPSARTGFKAFLRALKFGPEEHVLLPGYVGTSAREGSGVFDPISELGLKYSFYPLNDRLQIDLPCLEAAMAAAPVKVLLLIHYFGYVDPSYQAAVKLARSKGVWVVEDEAHAMFTDLVGGVSGRLGDAALFSLHKMLPLPIGGMLLLDRECGDLVRTIEVSDLRDSTCITSVWEYDFHRIASLRRENAKLLTELLRPLASLAEPLWGNCRDGEVPQTYPVLIRNESRDRVYQAMNDAGFGVVSLYHTLIKEVSPVEFPQPHWISRHILNLPVHQDIGRGELQSLVNCLESCLRSPIGQ